MKKNENKIDNVLRYIIENYPYSNDLNKTRTTKLVYLADWYMAQKYNQQMTCINWYFDHYGPYVSDVLDIAEKDDDLKIEKLPSAFGTIKYLVAKKDENKALDYELSRREEKILDKVIDETNLLSYRKFLDFIYDTYPIENSSKYSPLDLIDFSKKEKVRL